MTGTTFFSGLSLLTTAELVGMSGGALPACFTPLPVTRGSKADSLRDAWISVDQADERTSR